MEIQEEQEEPEIQSLMINSTHEDLYKQNTNILFVHDSSGWCVREFNKLSRVLREKLTVFRLVKNFTFYGTRMFMTAFTGACQFSPSGARSIQSTFSEAITFNIHFNIILQSLLQFVYHRTSMVVYIFYVQSLKNVAYFGAKSRRCVEDKYVSNTQIPECGS